ncbi:hypothetical protein PR048_032834 [Dryococelus australis]|uniref:Uncharacterized protein n=1 Tax=Dryococelus australis TaxID=614101 RepID=A0ABQ9G4H5_9NEOP|nr:hypothetical protein PR048_032834 [Dryococelus australis]
MDDEGKLVNARLHHLGSKLDPRSDLRLIQITVAPFESRAGLEIEIKICIIFYGTTEHRTLSSALSEVYDESEVRIPSNIWREAGSLPNTVSEVVFPKSGEQRQVYPCMETEHARFPHKASRVQSPAEPPDFRKWESCRTMPLIEGSSRGPPASPASSLRRHSIFTSNTLIGSQDLAVKSRPDLFTQLHVSEPRHRTDHVILQ